MKILLSLLAGVIVTATTVLPSVAQEIPSLRIPRLDKPPTIDGHIDPQEWAQAARITGFQDFSRHALTTPDLQPVWYLGYDDQNLYLAQFFPVYPRGTIKAHMKQGDNGGLNPNSDDILSDDHVEIQICDLPAREQAVKQYFYKIMTNPYGAVVDQRTEWSVGWMGFEWESKAVVRVQNNDDGWTMEMAIPWKNLSHPNAPADGSKWFVQLVSAGGSNSFYNAWQPVEWLVWDLMPEVVFDSKTPIFQLMQLGDVQHGNLDTQARIEVSRGQPPVTMTVSIAGADGKEIFTQTQQAPAGTTDLRFRQENLPLTDKRLTLHILAMQGDKIIYRAGMAFEKASETELKHMYALLAASRAGAGQPTLSSCYYHSFQKLVASCDVDILRIDPKYRAAKTFRTRIVRDGQPGLVLEATGEISAAGQGSIEVATPRLPNGDYKVVTELLANDASPLASRTDSFSVKTFPWEGNTLGTEKIVIKPFTPVAVDGMTLKVWDRSYRFAPTGLPESLISKGQEMLAAPIRLVARIEGKDVPFQAAAPAQWTHLNGHNSTIQSHGRLADAVDVSVQADTEYDGTTFYTLQLDPKNQARIDSLDLEIPLRDLPNWEAVRSSGRDVPYGVVPTEDGVFWDSSKLPAAGFIHGTFLPYCVLSDGERGLSWAADSDQDWLLDDDKPSFFLEKRGDAVLMRARFVNTASPLKRSRTIRFMLTAMPTKPLPEDYRYRQWATDNATFSWMKGFRPAYGMWAYGTGPVVSFYKQQQYDILKERLEQDRRRSRFAAESVPGPKFLPVNCWYVASNTMGFAMPEYDTYCGEWAGTTTPQPAPQEAYVNFTNEWGTWSTPRQQSRSYADLLQSTEDCRVYAYDQQQKQAGINGYWWDHQRFWTSGSLIKGTAYLRDDGQIQGIYNISRVRDMLQRMATCAEINGVRPFHGYYAHGEIGPLDSFTQWLWAVEGPWYLNSSKVSLLDNIHGGLDGIRILLQTYQGLPITMRNETFDKTADDPWQTRSCIGVALLFDVGLGNVGGYLNPDGSLPLGIHDVGAGFFGSSVNEKARSKVIQDLAKFDYFNPQVQWIPYWRTSDLIKIDGGDIVTTIYQRNLPNQTPAALLVLFNKGDAKATVTLSAAAEKLVSTSVVSLHDLENLTPDPLPEENGKWKGIDIARHGYRLMELGPRASAGE